jgi:serine/threonine-protein kinase HipA
MIKVWADAAGAGLLNRDEAGRGTVFSYVPGGSDESAVSVTMPVKLASYNYPFGLAPIFEMNLPEGILRERLRLAFAKATGTFDQLDVLAIVGRSQVGRLRYTGESESLNEDVPFQSVDEILASRRDGNLFNILLEKFATYSGVSGVQPKVLVRDEEASSILEAGNRFRQSPSFKGATHIVKFWDPNEFPQLAGNEYFCLKVAVSCGLEVPVHRLAEDGRALVIDRFDLRPDGTYKGFEDFCVLNGKITERKYDGSYETGVLKRFQQFANSTHVQQDLERLYTLIVVNSVLRNGDAHLKNFGITYDDVRGEARLAPVFDLVTTTAYFPKDLMALTLNGSTHWPTGKALRKLGESRVYMTPARITQLFESVGDAIAEVGKDLTRYVKEHPDFADIGQRMLVEWDVGRSSLSQ